MNIYEELELHKEGVFVTMWYKKNKEGVFEYNHFEKTIPSKLGKFPLPFNSKFKNQKSWSSKVWEKKGAFLKDNVLREI